ncbi:DUF1194 domain-containing protein [Pseudorhodobacter sp. MZDSW-24AT]|uniref:DUF1194 domain-containing protein n=1 Tax=Pseudorhodobacter sp. MZDSW-24AT TaxID=2052957 RepID=UPI000C1E0D61|nr:DUF1194 domain-containing protein [Pseudorhodobacter sp. MZDSW-24AT]PJF09019.1 hypothetical protein CUR21_11165 [Pseudorhodobacter sp. MZDSW-24AT]
MRWLIPLLLFPLPSLAQEVDLELVLLADASGSIDQEEVVFQRQGYASAITHPDVLDAISTTLTGTIAVTYVEWAANQVVVVDWQVIDGPEAAQDFAARLLLPPRLATGRNAIGAALLEGKRLIEDNPITSLRQVIDFSGDSVGNFSGPRIADARAEVLAAGITINGLPILRDDRAEDLVTAYENLIIGGPGAFVVAATSRDTFAAAVRRKLVLEIAGELPQIQVAQTP